MYYYTSAQDPTRTHETDTKVLRAHAHTELHASRTSDVDKEISAHRTIQSRQLETDIREPSSFRVAEHARATAARAHAARGYARACTHNCALTSLCTIGGCCESRHTAPCGLCPRSAHVVTNAMRHSRAAAQLHRHQRRQRAFDGQSHKTRKKKRARASGQIPVHMRVQTRTQNAQARGYTHSIPRAPECTRCRAPASPATACDRSGSCQTTSHRVTAHRAPSRGTPRGATSFRV